MSEPGYQSSMGTASGKSQSEAYNKVIEVATIRFAMIDMMKNPPDWARDIIRNHFTLHRDNIMHQCRGWAQKNPGVAALLPQLEEQLNKQTLADGSRPVLPVKKPQAESASAAAAAASASAPSKRGKKAAAAKEAASASAAAAAAAAAAEEEAAPEEEEELEEEEEEAEPEEDE
jgi:hypothetical protein